MSTSAYVLPSILVRTGAGKVQYCELCFAPVVDDPRSRTAHNLRMHPSLVPGVDARDYTAGADKLDRG
jgi:hypothetical protein